MVSPGTKRGQQGARCSIHARRNLPDKAFGYLERVRVTPGVCRPLARLNPSLRNLYWPGFRNRSHAFALAVPCVFIKQSAPPCHCDLRFQSKTKTAGTPYPEVTGLICLVPSLGVHPTRLRFLALGHLCRILVRTRRIHPNTLFTGSKDQLNPPKNGRLFPLSPGSHHCGTPQASTVKQGDNPAQPTSKRQVLSLRHRAYLRGTGILACFPFELVD